MTDPRHRRAAENAIWEDNLDTYWQTDDIDFAYPAVRYYDSRAAGTPGRLPEAGE